MRFLSLFTFVSVACVGFVSSRTCGTTVTAHQLLGIDESLSARSPQMGAPSPFRRPTVPVYFHVIMAGDALEQGNVPDSQVHASIDVLQKAFEPTGIKFDLKGITRTVNPNWFNKADLTTPGQNADCDKAMKYQLHTGRESTLNIYSVGFTENANIRGYATFPHETMSDPRVDGAVVLYSTLPGGSSKPFDLGHTVTHQVGHWLGALHTFEGGCTGEYGDLVDDTPPQAEATFGCPAERNTCANTPDPIHYYNFMDLTDDACMTGFTPGQRKQMLRQIAAYRDL